MATMQFTGRQITAGTITTTQISASANIPNSKLGTWDQNQAAGGFKLTGLADPTSAQDAATKAYVDAVSTGLDVKKSVRAASAANVSVTYSSTGGTSARGQITAAPNTLDGVSLSANDRILLKDQTTGAQNGIWVVTTVGTGSNGVWDRASDFDQDAEVTAGAFTFIEEGSTNADSGWVLTTDGAITIGGGSGTSLAFAQFSGAGSIVAGAGLTKTGSTLDVVSGNTAIVVNANDITLTLGTNPGLEINTGLKVLVNGTSLTLGASGLSVNLATNPGLQISSGLKLLLADSTLVLGGSGVQVQLASGSGLDVSTGLRIATAAAGAGLKGGGGSALAVDYKWEIPSGTVNGSNTAFTLSATPETANQVMVWVNGQLQEYTTHYTVSSTTLTFGDAPQTGDKISVFYFVA